jgi:hypothetical protein
MLASHEEGRGRNDGAIGVESGTAIIHFDRKEIQESKIQMDSGKEVSAIAKCRIREFWEDEGLVVVGFSDGVIEVWEGSEIVERHTGAGAAIVEVTCQWDFIYYVDQLSKLGKIELHHRRSHRSRYSGFAGAALIMLIIVLAVYQIKKSKEQQHSKPRPSYAPRDIELQERISYEAPPL